MTWDDVREVKRVVDELGIIESEVAPPAERAFDGSGEARETAAEAAAAAALDISFYQHTDTRA